MNVIEASFLIPGSEYLNTCQTRIVVIYIIYVIVKRKSPMIVAIVAYLFFFFIFFLFIFKLRTTYKNYYRGGIIAFHFPNFARTRLLIITFYN